MVRKKNIICISTIDWDFIWQGHQEIMSILAENDNRVLFIENTGVRVPTIKDIPRLWHRFLNWKKGFKGIRKEKENLYVYSPLTLPFPHSKIAIKINKMIMLSAIKRWMTIMEFHNPVIWSYLPTGVVLDMLDDLDPSIFIYYCADDFISSSKGAKKIKKVEEKVIKRADLVFTTSRKLYEHCASINKETHLFPSGINIDDYDNARENAIDIPDTMRNIRRPIVGYVGGLHKWVDMELLKRFALARKNVSIVLIGPKQTDLCGIDKLDNVFILCAKKSCDLPKFIKFFDAGIIPYRITKYTDHVYPRKINEYLAMGKPVISTEIPEVVELDREKGGDFIYFIKNERDLKLAMDRILKGESSDLKNKRVAVANENSWVAKIEKMCNLIENKLEEIELTISQDWLVRFKRFYSRARKRAIKIIGALAISYFIIFYTPFIWFVASPLEIAEKPQKADAIVVFGGGIGEGGSPGKSTVERARFSVDLYQEGFAKTILYSSGYTYKYNDAENMKLFAMSMGVPGKNIILDKKGDITYTNVKYTSEILRKKGFHKILLISSPYHMRRASLVFNHIAKDIDVIYTPVPYPEFYIKGKRVKPSQIKAIMHEYLGIVYYFFKGYI